MQDDKTMEEVLSAVRRTMAGEEAEGPTLAPPEPQSSREYPKVTDLEQLAQRLTY